jgi:nucleoid-associated protein YgaU
MNCPVCNHPGLPDYHSVPTFCPDCKSDLIGFMILGQIVQESESGVKRIRESESRIKRIKLLFAIVTSVLFILFIGLVLFLPAITNHKPDKSILQNDSIEYYLKLVKDLRQELKEKPKTADVYYIIKKDDNLSEIAKLFYNDGSRTKQIMTDNNLQKGYNLLPGDTLIIKIKTR